MRIRSVPALHAAFLALSFTVLASAATADVAGAQQFVEKKHGRIKELVEKNASSGEIKTVMDEMVDYDELARRTMGKPCPVTVPQCTNWFDKVPEAKQKELTSLVKQLVEKNYLKNMKKSRQYAVQYKSAKEAGEHLAKVRTEAKNNDKPREPAVQVDYVIMEQGSAYKVIDIVTEGSSMTKNYYDQSNKMMLNTAQGIDYLLEKYRKKIAKPATDE
jgi:phospholipid transport system substrate-binding protein